MLIEEIKNEKLEKHLKIVFEESEIEEKISAKVFSLSQNIKLAGFRKGKVPLEIVKKKYSKDLKTEVINDALKESIKEAIKELSLASDPKVEGLKNEGSLEFVLKLELMPKFEMPDFSTISLEKIIIDITGHQIDEYLKNVANSNRTFEKDDLKTVAKGDKVIIDFVGTTSGKNFANNEYKDRQIIVGEYSFIKEFNEELVGAQKQDVRDVKVTYPENHPNKEISGQEVSFKVTIKEVHKPIIPEVNDLLAEKLSFKDLNALRDYAKLELEKQYQEKCDTLLKINFFNKLEAFLDFDVPKTMAGREKALISNTIDEQEDDNIKDKLDKIIERRIKIGLLLSEYTSKHNIKIEHQEMQKALLNEIKKHPHIPAKEIVNYYYKNPKALENIAAPFFEDKVVKILINNEKVNITEKHCSLEEYEKLEEEISIYG